MAHQFLTNRMSDTTFLKDVDDRYNDLEAAIVYFFGLPTDADLYGRILDADTDGNIVNNIRSAAVPAAFAATGPGWRFRDTTNGDEFMVMSVNGSLVLYRNGGSQSSPTWIEENRMELATGLWDVISAAEIGTGCLVYAPFLVDHRSGAFVQFQYEHFDDAGYFDAGVDPSKLIIPSDGRYNIAWSLAHQVAGNPIYEQRFMTALYLNGSPVADSWIASGTLEEMDVDDSPVKPGSGVSQTWTLDGVSAGDYVQLWLEVWSFNDDAQFCNYGHAMIERIA